MLAHQRYRASAVTGWTRIDMLLALYSALHDNLWDGIRGLQVLDMASVNELRVKIHRQILGLIDGLNIDDGETPKNIMKLLLFVWDQIGKDDPRAWSDCLKIIQTLKNGFEGIADEARTLERAGLIPALEA